MGKYLGRIHMADYMVGFIKDSFWNGDTLWGFVMGRFFFGIVKEYSTKRELAKKGGKGK
jgi:hypothetical protein